MSSPEETAQATGFYPGGVCPFGIDDIPIYLDRGLESYEKIYPAAGTDASGVPMTIAQLLEITAGQICDCTRDSSD
jgi:prolyl-tRNA editing enzyme YbaK/EbsC (Cys-tRNA(Pro) deacylase)